LSYTCEVRVVRKDERVKKKIVIVLAILVLLLTVGLSYAYFTGMIFGKGKKMSVLAKEVKIIFTDDMTLGNTEIVPGWKESKQFSVENDSSDVFNYNIIMKDLVNTFVTEGFLQYKITSTNGYNMTEYEDIPKSSESKDVTLISGISIDAGVTQVYTIEFVYHDSDTVDQSADQGKTISGVLAIEEAGVSCDDNTLACTIKQAYPSSGTRSSFSSAYSTTALHEAPDYNASDSFSGTSYYFTGNPNNWVEFAGKKWRVIRINGNGSVRLLYAGSGGEDGYIGSSAYNNSYNHPGYVGWKYSTGSSLDAIRGNANKSNAYTTVENWYNALSSTDKNYIDTGAIYCNDRGLASGSSFSTSSTFYYAARRRLYDRKAPTLECSNTSDRFYNFGLMTADEVVAAGGLNDTNSPKAYYYLNASGGSSIGSKFWWTMSPYDWDDTYARVFFVYGSIAPGKLNNLYVDGSGVVRPVVSLKSSVLVTGGTGTASDPYKLTMS